MIGRVGPKYAERYVASGARTLASLPGRVKLTRAQAIGLKYIEVSSPLLLFFSRLTILNQDIGRLIPRKEMEKLHEALDTAVKSADPKFQSAILGSYRRGVAFSSDIDLVVRHKAFDDADDLELAKKFMTKLITQLEKDGLVCEENAFTNGPKKYSVSISFFLALLLLWHASASLRLSCELGLTIGTRRE